MKTLKNHVILYDSNCPLCKAYTGAFISCGLLDGQGRSAYNEQDPGLFARINAQQARNQIALVDMQNNTVSYGLDSLVKILGHQRPLVNGILRFPLVYYPAQFMYSLVSYNRKMISPARSAHDACVPDFNLTYRLLYILLTALFTGWVLNMFMAPVMQHAGLYHGMGQELLVVGGQVLFQTGALLLMQKQNVFQYLGNMMTVSMIGTLLLLPAIAVYHWAGFHFYYALVYFSAVVGIMFLLHLRRAKKLGLGLSISASWVVYRVLVLTAIIYFS